MKGERSIFGALVLGAVLGAAIATPVVLSFSQEGPTADPGNEQAPPEETTPTTKLEGEGVRKASAVAAKEATAERVRVDTEPRPPHASFGVVVYGTVTAKDGDAIESARVGFLSPDNDRGKNRHVSFEKGGYSVHGLTPGKWNVSIGGEGLKVTSQEVTVLPQEVQRLDLVAERSYGLRVKIITPAGEPLADALTKAKLYGVMDRIVVVATAAAPSGHLPMTFSRSHWRFGLGRWRGARGIARRGNLSKLPVDVAGEIEFDVAPPVFVSVVMRHRVLATDQVAAGQREITFKISLDDVRGTLTSIRVKVVDADTMAPIPKARVAVSDHQSGGGGRLTDANGIIVLKGQPSGLLEFEVWAKGYAHYHQNIRLEAGDHDLGLVRLSRPVKVVGRVVDGSGKPQAATIRWTPLDRRTFPQPLRTNRSASARADGKFQLWNPGSGRYLVQAFVRGKSTAGAEIDTARIGDKPIELVLQPVVKVAIDARGMAKTRFPLLAIRDANNLPVYANYLRGPYAYNAELAAGRYTYELHDDLKLAASGTLVVKAGGKPRIVVR